MAKKVLIDTDIGTDADDAVALTLAMASPELEIVGVIVTGKQAQRRSLLAKKLLTLGGMPNTPVYVGADTPVGDGELYWFGHEGQGILDDNDDLELEGQSGVEAYQQIVANQDHVEVIAIGSMSTLARAIDTSPEIAKEFSAVTIMGGHVRTAIYADTTIGPGIDYNLCIDPAASITTLTSGARITLIPCEITLQTWLTQDDAAKLAESGTLGQALATSIQAWAPIQQAIFSGVGVGDKYDPANADFLHDPLTVASTFSDICSYEEVWIKPTSMDGIFRTLEQPPETSGSIPIRLATSVDAPRFHDMLMQRLVRFAKRTEDRS